MMAYAEVSDLVARWKPLTVEEQEVAETLLEDASAMLSAQVNVDGSTEQAEMLKIVCCNMVKRAMNAFANDIYGVTQATVSADIYSQTMLYSNPTGDMYLTKSEKKMLGIANGYIGSLRPMIGDEHAPW